MPLILERHESHSLIRLEGEFTATSAAELKTILIEGLAAGKDLRLNFERQREVDITVMQLLWAAGSEAARSGVSIQILASDAIGSAARNAGFEALPGLVPQGH